jgi:4-hydroxythreonine-4-phosphate dehydrogenase
MKPLLTSNSDSSGDSNSAIPDSTPPVRLAVSSGEPAGIGPDLLIQLAQQARQTEIVVLADRSLITERAHQLGLPITIRDYQPDQTPEPDPAGRLCVLHIPLEKPCIPGQLDPANAVYVLAMLDRIVDGCQHGEFAGMVTAPVNKSVINDAGIPFSGHTEYLADKTQTDKVVMLLATPQLRVALATTHIPLSKVAQSISQDSLQQILQIMNQQLHDYFGLDSPCISVCGLNPHAGEAGHLGHEELEIIIPCLQKLRKTGMNLIGPLPADTAFTPRALEGVDAVLSMYHDQGLPVLKSHGFGNAVNITLGLPLIRTSVDHGTALDLAGSGQADIGSLQYAILIAEQMASSHIHKTGGNDD